MDFSINDAMVEMFVFETSQLLEQLEQVILSSDSNRYYTVENINEVFRIMHTIKGSSAMMRYSDISGLAHAVEDLFSYIRAESPKQDFCTALNDLILDCIDFIKNALSNIRHRETIGDKSDVLVNKLKDFLSELRKKNTHTSGTEEMNFFKAVITFEDDCEMENIRAYAIVHNLRDMATELVYYPQNLEEGDEGAESIRREGFQIYIKTNKSADEIYGHLAQTVFLKELELTEIDEAVFSGGIANGRPSDSSPHASSEGMAKLENPVSDQKHPSAEQQSIGNTQSIISVSVTKLDRLMDLVGEMVIAEAMVLQNPDLQGLELSNFHKAASQLSKITSEIQDMVMSVRMVPLSTTFMRMNRIVRDMCRKLNKEVYLEIIGEETEVDKSIIEHLTDPIMHLVRNSVDHGIESSEERQLAGKPQFGTITLEAKNAGSDVHIIIRDDGRGLDREKILKKAKENNLLTVDETAMSDTEVYKLILLPGFSTKENVTEFSGRGVGMDVVAKNIEAIGGSISIESEKNKGTRITLKIPLTLAIIDGMNLQVGCSTFTIPTISIQESFRAKDVKVIMDPDGNEMIMVRGQCYPLIRLHDLFKIKTDITDLSDGIVTMISHDGKTLCVFSDRLLGQQQVVVKSLPSYFKGFKRINGISGCTLLGDGSISLILDIASLINAQ